MVEILKMPLKYIVEGEFYGLKDGTTTCGCCTQRLYMSRYSTSLAMLKDEFCGIFEVPLQQLL
jgi:hypothetical protein